MRLTDAQQAWLLDHVTKNPLSACINCGNKDYLILDTIFEMGEYEAPSRPMSDFRLPLIAFACKTCWTLRFMSATGLGLLDEKWEAQS